ncbi:calmodulin-2/4 [Biomphalaria pfeifferi]|uniref:Calmodulin-2/4 n=1 Tax=Biomphalaria pfeifferi TaxID=112525 RepID=A0AAD8BUJ8_BIOPF|nr:calmodulin-2/4 [Biomphalaria pfeifferi]
MSVWQALFKAADQDHSGFLDKAELFRLIKSANDNVSEGFVEKFFHFTSHSSGPHKISFEEFVEGMKHMEEFLTQMTAFFHKFDINKNGCLEKSEFRKALEFTGRKYDDKEFETIFQKTDANKNGQISLEEFLKTMLQ